MDEQGKRDTRRVLADMQPITVDTTGRIIDLSAPLVNAPAIIGRTTTELVTTEPVLERIYTTTFPARIKQSFIDGEGIIYTYGATLATVAIATGVNFYYWVVSVVHTLIANAALIATDCALAVLAIIGVMYLLNGRGGSTGTVVVKGCARGPTPGPIRISR
jgi:hypothetical protein